ncbi:MAG: hypothetical protein EVA65_15875 [Oceanococcus sp.]|nr:MAG: hypothetical protein EVA65_15875 [Oceanococcus sp.]
MSKELGGRVQRLVGRLREYAKDWRDRAADAGIVVEAANEIERLQRALQRYDMNPDECTGKPGDPWPCVSHMAYETLRQSIVEAGWQYDDERDMWLPPNAEAQVSSASAASGTSPAATC